MQVAHTIFYIVYIYNERAFLCFIQWLSLKQHGIFIDEMLLIIHTLVK